MIRLDALADRINAAVPPQLAQLRASVHKNAGALAKAQLAKLDLVPRAEFEASRRMLEHTRAKLDALKAEMTPEEGASQTDGASREPPAGDQPSEQSGQP